MQQQSAVRELQIHAFRAFEDLQRFAKSEELVGILEELYSLPSDLRHEFVVVALMDDEVLRSRGIFARRTSSFSVPSLKTSGLLYFAFPAIFLRGWDGRRSQLRSITLSVRDMCR